MKQTATRRIPFGGCLHPAVHMPLTPEVPVLPISDLPVDTPLQRTLREQQTLLDSAGVGIVFVRQRVVVRCNVSGQ